MTMMIGISDTISDFAQSLFLRAVRSLPINLWAVKSIVFPPQPTIIKGIKKSIK